MKNEIVLPQRTRRDLAQYQRELTEKMARAQALSARMEPISVVAAGKVCRIDSSWIDFVENMPFITPLPEPERFVLGTCILRGRVLKVFDLALAMGAQPLPGSRIFAIKGRPVAITAALATAQDRERLPTIEFRPDVLGSAAKLLTQFH